MIEHKVWMFVTSTDLEEMAKRAREIEASALVGDSAEIKDWNCGKGVSVHIILDQERARKKGLMP